jgi:hypothetical protein
MNIFGNIDKRFATSLMLLGGLFAAGRVANAQPTDYVPISPIGSYLPTGSSIDLTDPSTYINDVANLLSIFPKIFM